jgi:hypothetical protein
MAAKIGSADRGGFRKSVAMLSNKEIVKKSNFQPKHWGKIGAVLRHRGLVWDES